MEKLSLVTGFASGNRSFDILHTKNELEKKKKTYNSVNLSKLPDKGAKLKNQIDELETILKNLTLEPEKNNKSEVKKSSNADGGNKTSKGSSDLNDKKSGGISSSDKAKVINTSDTANKTAKISEYKAESINVSNNGSYGKANNESVTKKCEKSEMPFSEASKRLQSNELLSFSDLTPKHVAKSVNEDVMNSPAFKSWRETGKPHKILLTEAKPLIDQSVSKSSSLKPFSSAPLFQTSEECIKKIHNSLATYPDDYDEESDPETLKSSLMLHQKRGLAWMMWREQQDPSGGILADDMGLGKTLSMISLILKQKERNDYCSFGEQYECKGTLIVCLASIIHQWNEEIMKHCEIDSLKVLVYHGPKRDRDLKRMKSYDVVLTTYNILLSERKAEDSSKVESPLFKLKWERIVLDEAHSIKNHVSLTAQAIFTLSAFRKWAITGTPIHNVFKDIYSLLKFLQFSPFDDLKKFKQLADNTELSEKRRSLVIKSLVLRRTKEQVDELGKPLVDMRNKSVSLCFIELSTEERKVYDKLKEKITNKFNQYLEKTSKLRSHSSLLVMLLRFQQCCNHLSLLKNEIEELDDSIEIANALSSLTIDENTSVSSDSGLDLTFSELETEKIDDPSVKSSKIKELFNKLHEIFESSENKDKSVIVSQWVSMLDIVALHLKKEGIRYHLIAGSTKVEDRQKYANDFNKNENGAKIMLLSLKAGGVGLNLIGANHLFLLDLHWNPALEMQACDRIHRVGQTKDVIIHKFICKNTIEEDINKLQNKKREIASNALHGVKQNTKGLSMDDFKMLFNVRN